MVLENFNKISPSFKFIQNLAFLRNITLSTKLDFQPGKYEQSQSDKLKTMKHKFVPCCEMLMTQVKATEPFKINPEFEPPKVVVIGAGLAGLSAAAALVKGGIKTVTVLEATDRLGGRIHSCTFGEAVIELGADYIEGGSMANPVYNLACIGKALRCPPLRYKTYPDEYVTTDGRSLLPTTNVYHEMKKLLYDAAGVFTSKKGDFTDQNLADFLRPKLLAKADKFKDDKRIEFTLIANAIINQIRARWGGDLSAISLEQFGSHVPIPGGNIRLPRGVSSVLNPLLEEIPADVLKLNKPVQCIRWNAAPFASPRASLLCCDGSEIPADYVIITVSLGVMKHAKNLFSPALPDFKQHAVNSLGFGYVNKIFMEYSKPFWLKSKGSKLKIAWTDEQLYSRDNWLKGISVIEEVVGRGNVLMCTVGGKEAIWTEELTDSQLAEELTSFIRMVTSDPSIPCPTSIKRSKWYSDLNFYGSRTFLKLGSSVKNICDLALPLPGPDENVPPILLFAGEATCPGHSSSLQGARLSGLREAHRIIGLTMQLEGPPKPPKKKPITHEIENLEDDCIPQKIEDIKIKPLHEPPPKEKEICDL